MRVSATPTPRLSPASRRLTYLTAALALALPLFLVACEIIEVLQPSQADQGEIIDVTLTIETPFDDAAPHKGVVSVLVPLDWSFVSGTYAGDASGTFVEAEDWADSTEIVLPAPVGMKWISAISSEAHPVTDAPATYDATLRLRVGALLGTYGLGYFTTSDAFATADIVFGSSDTNTADTLMNQPITVNLGVANEDDPQASAFTLLPNQPNPFRTSTAIRYRLDRAASVSLTVYDIRGRQVSVLARGPQAAGEHAVDFEAAGLPSGTYQYQLVVDGDVVQTRRMTLSK